MRRTAYSRYSAPVRRERFVLTILRYGSTGVRNYHTPNAYKAMNVTRSTCRRNWSRSYVCNLIGDKHLLGRLRPAPLVFSTPGSQSAAQRSQAPPVDLPNSQRHTVALSQLEAEVRKLQPEQALQLQDGLADYLEDEAELNPEFVASIERGQADLREGRVRS